jgi:hypothetical protein
LITQPSGENNTLLGENYKVRTNKTISYYGKQETNKNQKKHMTEASAVKDINTKRNNQELIFSPTDFQRGKKKEAGIKYPYTGDITEDTLGVFRTYLGDEDFFGLINENWRLTVQSIYNAVLENNQGKFNDEIFKKYIEELSTRGETKDEIEQKLKGLRDQMFAVQAEAEADGADVAVCMGKFLAITKEVKKYDAILASKKRVRKVKSEDEDSETTVATT